MHMHKHETPEQVLVRWNGIECKCDWSVGHLCECCHDSQMLRNLIRERDELQQRIIGLVVAVETMQRCGSDGECNPFGEYVKMSKLKECIKALVYGSK